MINHRDWKIHKRLIEATTVYIWPARGNSKPYTQLELYAELFSGGRRIALKADEGWDYFIPGKDYSNFFSRLKEGAE